MTQDRIDPLSLQKAHSFQKAGCAGTVMRSGLQPVGQKVRHLLQTGLAAGSSLDQREGCVPHQKKAVSARKATPSGMVRAERPAQ